MLVRLIRGLALEDGLNQCLIRHQYGGTRFSTARHTLLAWLALAWLLLACWVPLRAQPAPGAAGPWDAMADKIFQHVNPELGLPNLSVMALAQDAQGFIWAGTQDGLVRWDGYRFRQYRPRSNDPHSLPDNFVLVLFTDQRGRLWVGGNNGELAQYDPRQDQFVRVELTRELAQRGSILAMADDGRGGIWVGTRRGLFHVPASGPVQRYLHQASDANSLPDDDVSSLMRDSQGRLWVGTRNGIWLQDGNGQFARLALPGMPGRAFFVTALLEDASGRVWIGTDGRGLLLRDASGNLQALQESEAGAKLNNDRVQFILAASSQEVWVGTVGQGIVVVQTGSLQTRRLRHDIALPNSLLDNNVQSVLLDAQGLVWVGTNYGLSYHAARQNAILHLLGGAADKTGLSDKNVFSALARADGSVWLGLHTWGLNIVDPRQGRLHWLRPDGEHPETALPAARIFQLTPANNGQVYVASSRGLYGINEKTYQVRRLNVPPRDSSDQVRALVADGSTLWLGGRDGLWQIDLAQPDNLRAQRVAGGEQLNQQLVIALAKAPDGALWIGTRDNGLYRLDYQQHQQQPQPQHQPQHRLQHMAASASDASALSSPNICGLLFDSHGRLWVATQGGGIHVLDQPDGSSKRFWHIGQQQGLSNLLVNKILEDQQGVIWASTDGGLVRIDPATRQARVLMRAEGVALREYWVGAGAKTAQGELIFGGSGGLTVVVPARFRPEPDAAPLVVSSIVLGGKEVPWASFNPAPGGSSNPARPSGNPPVLEITPQANSLALEFAALDYQAPERIRYRYWLEGYDKQWIASDASRRLAAYTNLPPGDYRLHLQHANRLGEWTRFDRVVALRVLPAWYQTWWWRSSMVLLGLALVLALVQGRTRYLRKRQHELEDVVAERTQQLLQQAKIASLGTLTAGIAHEINNPSNFAHVGAYNLGTQLAHFQKLLRRLAGDEAPPELMATLQHEFDTLYASLAVISEGTSRIRDLVKDLRTYSRLDESESKAVAIGDSLLATVNLVRTQYASLVDIDCDLPANPVLDCAPAQLNQVFMNLIVNACQAVSKRPDDIAAQHPGYLHIRSRIEDGNLVLEFDDNGGGIPPEIVGRIFDPFFTTKTVGEGMGMGLSIALGIIEKHGGSIKVKSRPGVGSCFTLRLPLGRDF